MPPMSNESLGVLVALVAGLSTGIGATCVFCIQRFKAKWFCAGVSLAAGVMLFVSLVEMFAEGDQLITEWLTENWNDEEKSERYGLLFATVSYLCGWVLALVIDTASHWCIERGKKKKKKKKVLCVDT
eukprot:Trichotokara_eunicae@DN540_c0_g1_i1.p1